MKRANFIYLTLTIVSLTLLISFSYDRWKLKEVSSFFTRVKIAAISIGRLTQESNQRAQVSASLSQGLIAHYAFDEGSNTTATDSSGNGRTATLSGATRVTGKVGSGALSFDGSNDYVQMPASNSFGFSGAATIAMWTKTAKSGAQRAAVFYRAANSGGFGLAFSTDPVSGNDNGSGKPVGTYRDSSGVSRVCQSPTATNDNAWHYLVWSVTSTTGELYADGVSVCTVSNVSTTNTITGVSQAAEFGRLVSPAAWYFFQGQMDDVRIYDRPLTPSEIAELYALGSVATPPPPVSYTLSVSKTGAGTGSISGDGINCGSTCSTSINSGTSITLTATADSGSTFAGWSGACSGTSNCQFSVTADSSVTASFSQSITPAPPTPTPDSHTLSVSKSGTGSGTVTGGAINCGSSCSATLSSGASVTLTASASAGSTFVGWSGACSGTGSCSVTLNSNMNVSATFNLATTPTPSGSGTVRTAASCNYSDVNQKVSEAQNGDTVLVPAGTCTWSSTLTLPTGKNIILKGAGIGNTKITASTRWINLNSGSRITGFEVWAASTSTGEPNLIWIESPQNTRWRIDNNKFGGVVVGSTKKCIQIRGTTTSGGQPYGVIDNNNLTNIRIQTYGHANQYDWEGWVTGTTILGTDKAVYIEHNTHTQTTFGNWIDSNFGARWVVRYNTTNNGYIEAHGRQTNTSRGTRTWEIYGNTLNFTSEYQSYFITSLRGGTGVVFNNTATKVNTGTMDKLGVDVVPILKGLSLGGKDADGNEPIASQGTGTHTGGNGSSALSDSTKNWAANSLTNGRSLPPVDGTGAVQNPAFWIYNLTSGAMGQISSHTTNTVTATLSGGTRTTWNSGDSYKITGGYWARDQIGRGADAYLGNASDWPPQALDAAYFWDNTINGAPALVEVRNYGGFWAKENRDFYVNKGAKPGYTPYTYPHPLSVSGFLSDAGGSTPPPTNTYTLSVSKSGTGDGLISGSTNSPQATVINCGSTCSASIVTDSFVTLTATPTSNSIFVGWTQGCSGANPTCTIVMNSNQTVSAVFNLDEAIINQPPVVSAGPDQSIGNLTISLLGSVTDDGLPLGSVLSIVWSLISGPFSPSFDITNLPTTSVTFPGIGVYVLKLTASDSNLFASDTTTITITEDKLPPIRSLGNPSGTLATSTTAVIISLTTNEPASCYWSTSPGTTFSEMSNRFENSGGISHNYLLQGLTSGPYNFYVRCRDGQMNANTTDYPILFVIPSAINPSIDIIKPNVSITSPLPDTIETEGNISISATASDNIGVSSITFVVNGSFLIQRNSPPFETSWQAAPGNYTLLAVALDSSGNTATSTPVTVIVKNKGSTGTPPQTSGGGGGGGGGIFSGLNVPIQATGTSTTIISIATSTPKTETGDSPNTEILISSSTGTVAVKIDTYLKSGDRGDVVKKLQTLLSALGYLKKENITGFFGPLTEGAVKKFQCEKEIVCSGTSVSSGYGATGPKTRAALYATAIGQIGVEVTPTTSSPSPATSTVSLNLTKNLYRGLRTEEVTTLQKILTLLNYFSSENQTGFFGPLTEGAVKKFQCEKGIVCSGNITTTGYGSVGPKTRTVLKAALEKTCLEAENQVNPVLCI